MIQIKANAAGVSVTIRADGPIIISGRVVINGVSDCEDLNTAQHEDKLFLCRCGQSAKKPFCDGSHKNNNFSAPGVPVKMKKNC